MWWHIRCIPHVVMLDRAVYYFYQKNSYKPVDPIHRNSWKCKFSLNFINITTDMILMILQWTFKLPYLEKFKQSGKI